MQGLMLKLLNVDAAGERALRVVSYFDELLAHRPDLESVVRATAILADCGAGLQVPGEASPLFFTPDGLAPVEHLSGIPTASIEIDVEDAGDRRARAWLERHGEPGDFDDFILERMGLVITTVLERHRHARFADTPIGFADPALAALLVNDRASDTDRNRAARLMGIAVPGKVQTVAVALAEQDPVPLDDIRAALSDLAGRPVYVAQMTNDLVLSVVTRPEPVTWAELPLPVRAAIGPSVDVVDAPTSWASARQALRFAGLGAAWPRCLHSDQVGSLALLLGLDPQRVAADGDVRAIQQLSQAQSGEETVQILDHLLHAESLRSAARDANFHHSSLQSRVRRIEMVLGIDIRDGIGRQRAAHALLLWQLFMH